MAMYNLPITLLEFLQSKSFSDRIVLLQHDEHKSQTPSQHRRRSSGTNGGSLRENEELRRRQIAENATRVAYLLARSFDELCSASEIRHDEAVGEDRHLFLSSIELDGFLVDLDKDGDRAKNEAAEEGDQRSKVQTGPLAGCDDFREYYNKLVSDGAKKHPQNTVKDRNGKVLGMGYFSFNDASTGNADGDTSTEVDGRGKEAGLEPAIGDSNSFDRTTGSPSSLISGSPQPVYLYGVDIIHPTNIKDAQQQEQQQQQQNMSKATTPMQILGTLLYSVFCRGDSPPSDLFQSSAARSASILEIILSDADEEEDRGDTRPSRSSRCRRPSLFSQLVDGSRFPVSICRFLSDLIGAGPNQNASDAPFASFEEVLQELEQMMSRPSTFLHDSDRSSHGMPRASVLFGQKYYGRDDEVAGIIKAAAQAQRRSPISEMETASAGGVEAIFVSGIAGSGKSQLVETAAEVLAGVGWTFARAKFERGAEHASRGIVSSMFDEAVSLAIEGTKEEGGVMGGYLSEVSNAILDGVGRDALSPLADFLPSLRRLFDLDGIEDREEKHMEDWQLIHSLSKILEAVMISGHNVAMVCDDLQWADRTTLALISEVLAKLGENLRRGGRRCLFIGLYREGEVDDDHPFSVQYSYLRMTGSVDTTEVALAGLSKEDVANMITAELRLPKRLVRDLADVVHKKTSGHAYFIVELLNSLMRDGVVSYSPRKRRYAWDQIAVDLLQTGESVAELIASNLSSLPSEFRRALGILACFGIQTDVPLLRILEDFDDFGIVDRIDEFIERGILDRAGPIVIFTHDLIQQGAYECMPPEERRALHLEIGQYLGELASVDDDNEYASQSERNAECATTDPNTRGTDCPRPPDDRTFFAGSRISSSLISIACEQIDAAGPGAIADESRRLTFSEWNLSAGRQTSRQSDFRAALYYFSKGVEFLGAECWLNDVRLCLALHEGAVSAAFALGEAERVVAYSETVIRHVQFEYTLGVQQILLKSLAQAGKHNECIARGVDILRRLDFDIPLSPTMEIVMNSMSSTDSIASPYGVDDIVNLCEKVVDESAQGIVKIMDAFYVPCYASASAFLPLISCEIVKYALKHGVCQESTVAFASYGMFKIFFEGDYADGKKWAQVVRAITEKHQSSNKTNGRGFEIRAHILLYITIDIWFFSPRDVSRKLLSYHDGAVKMGQVDLAMISLQMGWRYLLYGGENLSMISKSFEERAKLIAKNSEYATKYVALDYALLAELTGQSADQFSAIEGMVCNIEVLQTEAEFVNNTRLLHHINVNNVMLAYWRGDYVAAEKSSHMAWKYPTAKMPTIVLIYHTLFGGLIAFRLFRTMSEGSDAANRLKEGRELMIEMGKWAQISMSVFGNKWLLLSAEHSASIHEHDKCKKLYQASIKVARDHGNIHELGLAYELLGNYCSVHKCGVDAKSCFKKAYTCYAQWGATSVAGKILRNHNLDLRSGDNDELQVGNSKRSR